MRAFLVSTVTASLVVVGVLAQGLPRPVAFTHVTLIDGTGSPAQADMTVVLSGDHIEAVGKSALLKLPANARIVNARNQFMLPGLCDMHSHVFMRKNKMLPLMVLQLFIANGVTCVRDMGDQGVPDDFGDLPYVQDIEWRQAIDAGAVIGPRLTVPGVIVDGPKSPRKGWASVTTPDEGRKLVDALKKMGVDFIKVYDRLPRDTYYAIADEAKKQDLTIAGHVPFSISAGEASDAGQRSEEHLWGQLVALSSRESDLTPLVNVDNRVGGLTGNLKALADTYSEQKANALWERFKKNGTFIVPTLVTKVPTAIPMTDPRIAKYMSPALRADYETRLKGSAAAASDPLRTQLTGLDFRMVQDMNRAGVKLLAGTDTLSFGFDLHDELELLVKAGLTPMQALLTATRNAAEFLGRLDSLGTVEKGKLADILVVDANPLDAIGNVRRIRAVIANGQYFDRHALDQMLTRVEASANGHRANRLGTSQP